MTLDVQENPRKFAKTPERQHLFKTQQTQDWENSPPTTELGLSGAGTVEAVFGDYQLTLWLRLLEVS